MKMKILVSIKALSGFLNASEIMLRSLQLVSADSKSRVMHIGMLVEIEKEANLSVISTKSNKKQATIKIEIKGIKKEENKDLIINQIKQTIQRICDVEQTTVSLRVERLMIQKKF